MARRLLRWLALPALTLAALWGAAWPWLSPDLQRAPAYVWELATGDGFVVNTPFLPEIFGHAVGVPDEAERARRLHPAPGFAIGVFAEGIPHPRVLRFTRTGDLLVSQPRKGRVLLLARDADGDGRSDGSRVLVDRLEQPHGLELWDGWLYVAEPHAVRRARFDAAARALGPLELVVALPQTSQHASRVLRIGPDGWLYYPIGADCNICEPSSPREQAILRARPDGSGEEVFASGFRNVFGFDWRPATGDLFALDVGADTLGDHFPPEELDRVERGGFYGFPDASLARAGALGRRPGPGPVSQRAREPVAPVHTFPAHTTPLGLSFLRDPRQPAAYHGAAIVAFHGSWNSTKKVGYRLISLHFGADGEIEERDFVTGFERDEDVIGRPVDVAEGPDAAIYVSDDYAGAVYRIYRAGGAARRAAR